MKLKHIFLFAAFALAIPAVASILTSDQQNLLNDHFGPVARQVRLGDLIQNGVYTLSNGKIMIGNGSSVATEYALSGDITMTNAGVTSIGAGKVTEAMQASYSADGLHSRRVAKATMDCSAGDCAIGAHSLGVSLPASSVITHDYMYVKTQFVDAGTCTVALHCEDAGNIFTAADITGTASGGFIEGNSSGGASVFVGGIGSSCAITATVADGGSCAPSAGYLDLFVEYVVVD